MVKQAQEEKTSSRDWRSAYHFPSFIVGGCYLPATIETTVEQDSGGKSAYAISGTLLSENGLVVEEKQDQWPEPPHLAFANLRLDDAQSAEAFIKRYGLLQGTGKSNLDFADRVVVRGEPVRRDFVVRSSNLKEDQLILRAAWEGDPLSINSFEFQVAEGTKVDILINQRSVQLRTEDLWTFIAFLFLFDYKDEKLGICENPECPAPYFRKKRKTQKFCEAGPCVAYAQRQYSLDWWNRVGKKKREKKAKTQHRRSKP
jgi:hypothetical protein